MKIKIKRTEQDIPLLEYKTQGAAAFDFYTRETKTILPGEIGYIPLNVAIEVPEGYFLLMAARSGLHKRGLMLANGIAVFDPDFSGDEDEYIAVCFNFSKSPVIVERGERITQGLLIKSDRITWEEVQQMKNMSRGGLGSTGHK